MPLLRRSLIRACLSAGPALLASRAFAADTAAPADPRLADRALGKPDAPVTTLEWFSLTCPHCARFSRDVLPRITKELVEPGKLRYVFKDFPLDQVALTAAMVARSLPADRYEPFCSALLASQDRWAFARGVNTTQELGKIAALAGMSPDSFKAAIADTKLRDAILAEQETGVKTYGVDSTPFFIFRGPGAKDTHDSGELSFDAFSAKVTQAASA